MANKREATNIGKTTHTFQIVEAYKTLRTNLMFALSTIEKKTILVSSAEPSAGKSTTTSNLAITMAQLDAKTLIIDTDMRKPAQYKIFKINNSIGLSKILGGFSGIEENIHRNISPNLDLISSGPIPPNPSELLSSSRMDELLETVSEQYDYVLIDGAPVNVVSDSLVLCEKVGGVLLIARQNQTTYEEILKAKESLSNVHGNLLGVAITDVKQSRAYGRQKNYKYKSYTYTYGK